MENVVLVIHLLLALSLIGVVLMQRSEGGGLGIGGGGGGGGLVSSRGAATALGKLTWILAIGFIITSVTLTMIAASAQDGSSVVDGLTGVPVEGATDGGLDGELLLPPTTGGAEETPLVPDAN